MAVAWQVDGTGWGTGRGGAGRGGAGRGKGRGRGGAGGAGRGGKGCGGTPVLGQVQRLGPQRDEHHPPRVCVGERRQHVEPKGDDRRLRKGPVLAQHLAVARRWHGGRKAPIHGADTRRRYTAGTRRVHGADTRRVHGGCTAGTRRRYTAGTRRVHGGYTAGTRRRYTAGARRVHTAVGCTVRSEPPAQYSVMTQRWLVVSYHEWKRMMFSWFRPCIVRTCARRRAPLTPPSPTGASRAPWRSAALRTSCSRLRRCDLAQLRIVTNSIDPFRRALCTDSAAAPKPPLVISS